MSGDQQVDKNNIRRVFMSDRPHSAKTLTHTTVINPLVTNKSVERPATITDAEQRYHQAWQQYYQRYYQNYYMAELAKQRERFARQLAQVKDQREADGVLEQRELQSRLKSQVREQASSAVMPVVNLLARWRQQIWFWPAVVGVCIVLIVVIVQFSAIWQAQWLAFTQPALGKSNTALIGDGNYGQPIGNEPRVIIPKLNVDAPVTYGLTDVSEHIVQQALRDGAVNYPVTDNARSLPGQKGNAVILGHSSASFLAPGNYKFIFVQLNQLVAGDIFFLDYGGHRYAYKVVNKRVINPNQLDQLNLGTNKAYATLVTCDPPGTTAKRLLVIAEQVS